MMADPPELVGQRVRFLVVVVDGNGEVERARARVWTDNNLEVYRKMSKDNSQAIAKGLVTGLVGAIETGSIDAIPSLMKPVDRL